MSFIIRAYQNVLSKYPVGTNIVQTGLLTGSGDVISQVVVENKSVKDFNYKRTLQFFAIGSFYVGPALTVWYRFLQGKFGHGGKSVAFKKVAVDQLGFAPVILAGFISITSLLHGENVKKDLERKYTDVLVANWKLWPAVQLVNFCLVPLPYQVLYVQVFALAWNTYLCHKTKPSE